MRILLVPAALAAFCALSSSATAQEFGSTDVSCTVGEVAVYADRVHVFCKEGGAGWFANENNHGGIKYFAVAISDPIAPHVIAIASAALVTQRPIGVVFDPNGGANPPGCLAADCRKALAVRGG